MNLMRMYDKDADCGSKFQWQISLAMLMLRVILLDGKGNRKTMPKVS
jgi:hypothetical protein